MIIVIYNKGIDNLNISSYYYQQCGMFLSFISLSYLHKFTLNIHLNTLWISQFVHKTYNLRDKISRFAHKL